MWVGDYDNARCSWELSDSVVRSVVSATATDPKVAGYFISDEPDPFACPSAPEQHTERSDLIGAVAPGKFTVMVIDSNSGRQTLAQLTRWKSASTYQGIDPYPCYRGKACDFTWIHTVVSAANRAGLHYWGVVQAFDDTTWRWPTPLEERHMLEQWAASRESGSMTFAWEWDGRRLASRPGLLRVLSLFNRSRAPHSARSARRTRALTSRVERGTARELHYTYAGPSAVTFDWSGTAQVLHYGRTASYGATIKAHAPQIKPFSSAGPFWEATVNGLKPGRSYRYSVGPIRSVFRTPPVGPFRFDFEADVGASDAVLPTQNQIAADKPAFTIVAGDLTYGNDDGQAAVDRHFDDVMAWSRRAAYVPAWGNHEWDSSSDDLRNYKGRFTMPHAQAAVGAPARGCCGDDWGWFDAGGVRFISYPEPYTDATWPDWGKRAAAVMAAAETNPRIHFIVTFGHRPAYSTGYHPGDTSLASVLNGLGDRFSKYVLNLNGHSHDYERFNPIHHVVHITAGGGGADLEPWSSGKDRRDAFRALHLEHLRVDVSRSQIRIQTVCGPSSSAQDLSCRPGSVIDSYAIAAPGT